MTTSTADNTQIIDIFNNALVIVRLDFHSTTGQVSFDPSRDLGLPVDELPPKEFVRWGSKQAIDPKDLKIFGQLYNAAKHLCSKHGLAFMGGYAIPADIYKNEVKPELDEIVRKYKDAKKAFLAQYHHSLSNWCNLKPEWAALIRDKAPSIRYLERQISAAYMPFSVQPSAAIGDDDGTELANQITGLSDTLYEDIAKHATKFLNESIYQQKGSQTVKETVTQSALRPIRFMRDKLDALSFIAPGVRTLIQNIDTILEGMPKTGAVKDEAMNQLFQLALLLSDVDKMRNFASHVVNTKADDDDFFDDGFDVESLNAEVDTRVDPQVNTQVDDLNLDVAVLSDSQDDDFEDDFDSVEFDDSDYDEGISAAPAASESQPAADVDIEADVETAPTASVVDVVDAEVETNTDAQVEAALSALKVEAAQPVATHTAPAVEVVEPVAASAEVVVADPVTVTPATDEDLASSSFVLDEGGDYDVFSQMEDAAFVDAILSNPVGAESLDFGDDHF